MWRWVQESLRSRASSEKTNCFVLLSISLCSLSLHFLVYWFLFVCVFGCLFVCLFIFVCGDGLFIWRSWFFISLFSFFIYVECVFFFRLMCVYIFFSILFWYSLPVSFLACVNIYIKKKWASVIEMWNRDKHILLLYLFIYSFTYSCDIFTRPSFLCHCIFFVVVYA